MFSQSSGVSPQSSLGAAISAAVGSGFYKDGATAYAQVWTDNGHRIDAGINYRCDAINLLRPGGGVFFEIGDGQGPALQKRLFDAGFDSIRIEPDYAGHDRYASAVLP